VRPVLRWRRKCVRPSVTIKVSASLLLLVLLATSCSTPRFAPVARFDAQDQANLIVRYYTDDTSYLLKPAAKNGPFLAVLNKDAVLEVAKHQPGRQLAVVVLVHYAAESEAEAVKSKWKNLLTEAGYQRVVFLRGRNGTQVNGLPILASRG
jgi:hypothetical protein